MVVSSPLSRGLDNIPKVYLITCDQSTCSKLKKLDEFCRNFNEKYPHLFSYLLYNYNVQCVHNNMDVYAYCILFGCFTSVLWSQYELGCFTSVLWSQYQPGCFTPVLWSQYELGCFTPVLWSHSQYELSCFTPVLWSQYELGCFTPLIWSQYQPGCFTPVLWSQYELGCYHPSAMVRALTIRA